jgi:hypothetical protein
MLFWPTMMKGISPSDIEKEEITRYRCAPIDVKSIRLDWMLEDVSEDDKQPYVYRLLNEIMKKDISESEEDADLESWYDIPAVQALIRFHHSKLQDYIFQPFILGLLILDLVQILAQMLLINQLIYKAGEEIED